MSLIAGTHSKVRSSPPCVKTQKASREYTQKLIYANPLDSKTGAPNEAEGLDQSKGAAFTH
jgi:hypothetical protein